MKVERVPIGRLTPHPRNPRRGDIAAIAESLKAHGQYRPIVASSRSGHILAGNHTWKAAQRLGLTEVSVVWADVEGDDELAILLADNRLSDLATTNDELVAELLEALPDLTGTGYTMDDAEAIVERPKTEPSGGGDDPGGDKSEEEEEPATLRIGKFAAEIDEMEYLWWSSQLTDLGKRQAIAMIRERLMIPDVDVIDDGVPRGTADTSSSLDVRLVDVDSLRPHRLNPREGDVGALVGSLDEFGQYRPIVVNHDGTILVGAHLWAAAKAQGWQRIWAAFVNVPEEQAVRIMLVDNRTADLASYAEPELKALLLSVSSLEGTGFDGDDLDALVRGAPGRPSLPKSGKASCWVGEFRWRENRAVLREWSDPLVRDDVADRLGLPRSALR